MKNHNLFEFFKHFEGQPVEVFTDDGRVHCGIDCESFDGSVRIIDKCGRVELIDFDHIDSVVEPQMRLRTRCKRKCCDPFDDDDDDDCEFDLDCRSERECDCDRRGRRGRRDRRDRDDDDHDEHDRRPY